ncbi:OadG family protein [Parabacteroides sp. OttesenSCG-928-G07]|nr:OadG family protein [Parabacteroides sp. OttesenSCG-928-G21]MDL2278168.1 OadG family protein [Parabacteroides sp. OttesenSCG-928-G07]
MENISIGLLLMVVGMTTVFAILFIVIYLGKGLIAFVNKYVPEEVVVKQQVPARATVATSNAGGVSNQETAAIVSALSVLTGGKGKVTKIEKK